MKFKSSRHTVNTVTLDDGTEVEIDFEAVDYLDNFTHLDGDNAVVAYLVQDSDYDTDMGDCMGMLYSFHRNARRDDLARGLKALGNTSAGEKNLEAVWDKHADEAVKRYAACVMADETLADIMAQIGEGEGATDVDAVTELLLQDGNNYNTYDGLHYADVMEAVLEKMWDEPEFRPGDKDAQMLACYEHGGQHWSLSGGGTQCRWDTSNQAGVWVPDEGLRKQLDDDEKNGLDRATKAEEYAQQFLNSYNSIISGDVYGCVVQTFKRADADSDWEETENDACWGFIGSDYAETSLKSDYFEPVVAALRKTQAAAQ